MIGREFQRQFLHIIGGSLYILATIFLEKEIAIALIAAVFVFGFLVSYIHTNVFKFAPVTFILKYVERKGEKSFRGIGALSFTLAVLISSLVFYNFPKTILIGALLVLTFGDGVSTLAGKAFGKTRIAGKTLEGTAAGTVAGALPLLILFPAHVAIIASFAGMLAEFIPVDDNYTIPVVAGFSLLFLV